MTCHFLPFKLVKITKIDNNLCCTIVEKMDILAQHWRVHVNIALWDGNLDKSIKIQNAYTP